MSARGPRKAFLLAAGLGTRLKPLTDKTPKCLVLVGGKPVLHWWLTICERLGVQEVLINTHHLADQVVKYIHGRPSSLKIRLVHEPELLGSGGTLSANKDFVVGEPDFFIFYADTLIGGDLSKLYDLHRSRKSDLTLGLFESSDPRSGGVVEINSEGKILSFEEKPVVPKSNLVAAGAYVAGPKLLDGLPSGFSDLSHDVYPKLMDGAYGAVVSPVIDLGTPDSYARAQKEWSRFGLRD